MPGLRRARSATARRPKLTVGQIELAQQLYDAGTYRARVSV
ncbi:MAG: hypothetical protein ACRDTX_07135 [Pseudonocardiaceae bacterium]